MVNEEYLEEVRKKYGKCECGADVEFVILKESVRMYHINFIGELSKRYIIRDETPTLVEGMCYKCYLEKGYDKMQESDNQRKEIKKELNKIFEKSIRLI